MLVLGDAHADDPANRRALLRAYDAAEESCALQAGDLMYYDLPYRTCVGIMLINADGLVFIGRRIGGPEHVDQAHVWQMPQGGVDAGEDTWAAAKRELYEETNARSVERLGEVPEWLTYDIPRTVAGRGAGRQAM